VQQRLPSLLDPPIAFAHRGARAHAPDNTIESFALALRLGATGLESDVWVTADGVPVLDHDGVVRRGVRRRPISEYDRADLPEHIPSLDDLFDACGDDYALSLDVKTPGAMLPTAAAIRARGNDLAERTWLCDPVLSNLVGVRDELAEFKLVHSTRLAKLTESPELHASRLSAAGIDAMNMHRTDWNGGLVVMFHRFDRYAFCWDLQFDHQIEPALRMGVDAIYSDHTDLMVDVMSRETGAG
jgi:glycerophosphoryl diester phosphodiesterase